MATNIRTGKNGTAGVGDSNPAVDVAVEEIGEFAYGAQIVEISEVGRVFDGELHLIGFPTLLKGGLYGSGEQRKLMEKARRLAKATLPGAVQARYLGVVKAVPGEGWTVRFHISRNRG